jgi:hypothetical protein
LIRYLRSLSSFVPIIFAYLFSNRVRYRYVMNFEP